MQKTKTQLIEVTAKDNGIRLDKWFLANFPNLKFGHLQKLLRSGQIRIDSKRAKGSSRIQTGQKIRIPPLDLEAASQKAKKTPIKNYKLTDGERNILKKAVIYEDKNIVALNKPYGIATQGGSKQTQHLDGMLFAYFKEQKKTRPHLVHRLDKETSGILILAKDENIARKLGKIFKEQKVEKYYWAVCLGRPDFESGEIIAPLKKQKASYGEYISVDKEEGKYAKTYYQVVEQLGSKLCLIIFKPLTGRTHQLRVHASIIGCPILGDKKYASAEQQQRFAEILQIAEPKLHLHAQELIFELSPKKLKLTATLPEHMTKTWAKFNFPYNLKNSGYFDAE